MQPPLPIPPPYASPISSLTTIAQTNVQAAASCQLPAQPTPPRHSLPAQIQRSTLMTLLYKLQYKQLLATRTWGSSEPAPLPRERPGCKSRRSKCECDFFFCSFFALSFDLSNRESRRVENELWKADDDIEG
ncbi:hypothetical protein CCMA1212_009733 [Trichoderma ghanense]|uniref:Uncharacterized protein n=1 Tax=Trichoderma ghanense TaxID=65468 RepID=A0ABY2GSP3_9HYPO